ncbi:MAG: 2-dehydropantoate 2-reductase N-terminal domain-containing protein [Chitinophagales bacterium]
MKQNILIIGAGAVGLVYGRHLALGGHAVTFYVREKYVADFSKGSVLYHMNKDKSLKKPIHFKEYGVVSSFEAIGETSWDQIYLCISSTALQSFDLAEFKRHLMGSPTIVMLQPSAQDYECLTQYFPAEQIVEGMITLISYATPLATESVDPPGTAYWLPPLAPTPFSGETKRRDEVIKAFQSGGLRSSADKNVQHQALFPTAFLTTFLTALEANNWKFNQLSKNTGILQQLQKVVNEVFTTLETKYQVKKPFGIGVLSAPIVVKLLLKLAPIVMPMDIETYFEYHFKKVNDQTKLYMKNYELAAKEVGVAHKNLEAFNQLN